MLPYTGAVDLLGHSPQGQTLPLIFECSNSNGHVQTYQAKVASRRNGLSPRELACEMLCTILAEAVGLHVSKPSCIRLPIRIVQEIDERYAMGIAETVGAGVEFFPYLSPFIVPIDIAATSALWSYDLSPNSWNFFPVAGRLLAFDLLVANGDRTAANPNLAWDDDQLFVFDFEHCLEFGRSDYAKMLDVHIELLPNLRDSHIVGHLVTPETLEAELTICLQRLEELLRQDDSVDSLPEPWHDPWLWMSGYLRHVWRNRDVIIRAATADI